MICVCIAIGSMTPLNAQERPQVGDFGFRHEEFHDLYQKLYPKFFGKDKCHCSHGKCRPSSWRQVQLKAQGARNCRCTSIAPGATCPVPCY